MINLTIVLPIKETEELRTYLMPLHSYLNEYPSIVVNEFSLSEARKYGINRVDTEYTLCLDLDTILPEGYIEKAIKILDNNSNVMVVAIDYEKLQGHLAFGTSIWRTKFLKEHYNWDSEHIIQCECIHMLRKVIKSGYVIETLPMRAKHLKVLPVIPKHLKTNKE